MTVGLFILLFAFVGKKKKSGVLENLVVSHVKQKKETSISYIFLFPNLLIFLMPLNLTYYQPRLLVLNLKIMYIIKIKLIFLCHIDSIQYAGFRLHLIVFDI